MRDIYRKFFFLYVYGVNPKTIMPDVYGILG